MSDATTSQSHDKGHHHGPNHDYHLLDPSVWPLFCSIAALVLFVSLTGLLEGTDAFSIKVPFTGIALVDIQSGVPFGLLTTISLLVLVFGMFGWWFDVIKESRQGDHKPVVQVGLRYGMLFFIASEVMFFFAFFFAYFFYAVSEGYATAWPPSAVAALDMIHPFDLPLFNTVILLLSGTTVTWAHEAIRENKRGEFMVGLGVTVVLGIFFSLLQLVEYIEFGAGGFGLKTDVYTGVFYIATGFHGFHVLIGTLFLAFCWFRGLAGGHRPEKHFGFEAAAWYWHFVDVVWIFLFVAIYMGVFDRG